MVSLLQNCDKHQFNKQWIEFKMRILEERIGQSLLLAPARRAFCIRESS